MAQQGTLTNPSAVTQATSVGEEKSLRWFFVGMAALLLVIVAVGFAPSFYLPDTFGPTGGTLTKTALPAYIVAHGVVLSLWYILLLVQPLLVATGRTHVHQKLGIIGVTVAVVMVPLSLFVVTKSVARSNLEALPVIADYFLLLLFSCLVALAVRFRHKPDIHKRLMLIASIGIVAPAIARWPGAESAIPISVIGPQLLMLGALAVHDLVTRKRVHRATGWGVAAYLVAVAIAVPLAMSPLGESLVRSLK